MTTTQTDALMALADRYAFHIPGSQHSDEARAALLAALQEQAQEPVAWRKKSANGEWVLYYQNVGWKDLSGFEPLYPVQKSAAKVVQLTEDQTEELIEDLCNTYGLSGDLGEVVSIVVEFINKAAK